VHPLTPGPGKRAGGILDVRVAEPADAPAITHVLGRAATDLTDRYGKGHWSHMPTEPAVLRAIAACRVLVASDGGELVGTLALATKKPWAIDRALFDPCKRPLYLVDMAVDPSRQRKGVGRLLIEYAKAETRAWPAGAIWLDAYDFEGGAGPFYARCGFREVGRASYRSVPLIYYEWKVEESGETS
jgi:GNAT superfamily N-acetyltransferase